MKIGVLALQGDFDAHRRRLEELGAEVVLVKKPEQLDAIDGLIIPGGESGTFLKLLGEEGFDKLRQFVHLKPTFGTCAGAILSGQRGREPSTKRPGSHQYPHPPQCLWPPDRQLYPRRSVSAVRRWKWSSSAPRNRARRRRRRNPRYRKAPIRSRSAREAPWPPPSTRTLQRHSRPQGLSRSRGGRARRTQARSLSREAFSFRGADARPMQRRRI